MTEKIKATTRVDGKTVDREVGEAFKTYVLKKHGKIRGVFSEEVTKALKMYLQEVDKKGGGVDDDEGTLSHLEKRIAALNKRANDMEKQIEKENKERKEFRDQMKGLRMACNMDR